MQNDPVDRTYNYTSSNDPSLSARNQQRLRKLRDLEGKNLLNLNKCWKTSYLVVLANRAFYFLSVNLS